MIPKIIHYCWFGGKPKPDDINKYIASWKKYCPDYEIREWNESNFDINENDYCREAYEAKKWAFVTDYVRLKVLYEYGGFYMDTDVEVVKPLDPLCVFNAVAGYESEAYIQTGVIGACLQNEWISMLLQNYKKRHFLLKNGEFDSSTNVTFITTLTANKYSLNLHGQTVTFGSNMVILPFDYLCAKNMIDMKIYRTKHTYTIHHFEGSWLSEEEKYFNQVRLKIHKFLPHPLVGHIARYCTVMKYHGVLIALRETLNWIRDKEKI